MRNWLRASSLLFYMSLVPIFAPGCDSQKSSNESPAPTAFAKHATINAGVGTGGEVEETENRKDFDFDIVGGAPPDKKQKKWHEKRHVMAM